MDQTPPFQEVRYAVLQNTLQSPPVDKLRRAFESVKSLTAADAPAVANDAYGILLKNLRASEAPTLKQALDAEGIETELVPEKLLPHLPATKFVRRFELGEDALLIHDPLGRKIPLEYRHLLILAAGEVEITEFQRRDSRSLGAGSTFLTTSPLRLELEELELPLDTRQRERRVRHHFIELVLHRGAARFTIEVDTQAHLVFEVLGNRRGPDFLENLALLVRELANRVPQVLLNRGAYLLRREPPSSYCYPTRNAFHEEMTWLLWKANGSNLGRTGT